MNTDSESSIPPPRSARWIVPLASRLHTLFTARIFRGFFTFHTPGKIEDRGKITFALHVAFINREQGSSRWTLIPDLIMSANYWRPQDNSFSIKQIHDTDHMNLVWRVSRRGPTVSWWSSTWSRSNGGWSEWIIQKQQFYDRHVLIVRWKNRSILNGQRFRCMSLMHVTCELCLI